MKIENASVDVRHLHTLLNSSATVVPEAPIHMHIYLNSVCCFPNADQLLDEMVSQKNELIKKFLTDQREDLKCVLK